MELRTERSEYKGSLSHRKKPPPVPNVGNLHTVSNPRIKFGRRGEGEIGSFSIDTKNGSEKQLHKTAIQTPAIPCESSQVTTACPPLGDPRGVMISQTAEKNDRLWFPCDDWIGPGPTLWH